MKESYRKTSYFLGLTFFLYFISGCNDFFLFEYVKAKVLNLENFRSILISTQFVTETSQSTFCYLSVSEIVLNQNGQPNLFKIYLPRQARVLIQQIFLLLFVYTVLFKKNEKEKYFKNLNYKFYLLTIIGLFINYYLVSIYVDFETVYYISIFLIFSIFKSLIVFLLLNQKSNHLNLFILCLFPLFSTGFGINWMFDFLIYYLLFTITSKFNFYSKNLNFLIVFVVLFASLSSPFLKSPSLETEIIKNPSNFNQIINDINVDESKKTYLEKKDIRYLKESINSFNNDELAKEVNNLSRNLKDTNYPNRWNIMVSFLPDFKYHLPSFFWYLCIVLLFSEIFYQIKKMNNKQLQLEIEKSSNLLIIYPVLSLFLGVSYFFNSISEFLFFLTRKSEMIDFGLVQTWRGINTHYEIFSNLQIFIFCFFLFNFYINRSSKHLIYIIISSATAILSQSRFTVLILFIFLFLIALYFIKNYKIETFILLLSILIIFQLVPVFEREEPFFIDDKIEVTSEVNLEQDSYGFEFISDRLNRTLPWTMFASGYKPDTNEFIFGHGPGAYLNIIKFTNRDLASGPHSIIFQILNKFGLFGILISLFLIFKYLIYIGRQTKIKHVATTLIIFSLLLSLEIKTDSLMLTDGVVIFGFNILLGVIFKKLSSFKPN